MPVSGLKGPRVAEGHIRYSRMLNNERGFGAELNQSPWSSIIVLGDGTGARKKQHLSRGSRVKTYSDICFGGHSIPARINVLPPFNFT